MTKPIKRTTNITLESILPYALVELGIIAKAEDGKAFLEKHSIDAFVDTTPGIPVVSITILNVTERAP